MSIARAKPVFSVVVPIYNVEKYIEECIQSVLDQTYSNFEIICVDDGSPDHSLERVQQFNDPRIRIVRQKNRGLAAARNTGINASRGLYIALLDSDDFWHPTKLAQHFKHLNSNPRLGVSYSASLFVDDNSQPMGLGQFPKLTNIDAADIFCRNPVGNGSAAVLRKSMLLNVARQAQGRGSQHRIEYFDESMRQSEDVEFWLRVALTTNYRFEGIGQALTYYRVNASGLSANLDKQYQAWLYSVNRNRSLNPEFYAQWFSLACAFQKLYLARRAIKSGQGTTALKLVHEALLGDPRILLREPAKTTITYGAAYLSLLPKNWFERIFQLGTQLLGQRA
ncbi:MAG: glucosyl transferase [Pseudomonadales bacterium]|nr:glucosyl transferase [Pseudomonadales bacterium]